MVSVLALQQNDQYLELMFVCFFMDFACSPFGCVCVYVCVRQEEVQDKEFLCENITEPEF